MKMFTIFGVYIFLLTRQMTCQYLPEFNWSIFFIIGPLLYIYVIPNIVWLRIFTWIRTNTQTKSIMFASNMKGTVFGISLISFEIFQVDSKFISPTGCNAMKLFQSKPELAKQTTKSFLVIFPFTVEVKESIIAMLKHGPSFSSHITHYSEAAFTIRIDLVNVAVSLSWLVVVQTTLCWK